MRLFRCLIPFLFVSFSAFSAGPIMHLWLADRFCEISNIQGAEDRRELFIGTEFPDIRYIAHFPRHLTHPEITSLSQVYDSLSFFEMGLKLHAWLDYVRENQISKEVYEQVGLYSEGMSATLLKFIEDEILSDERDFSSFVDNFGYICDEEVMFAEEGLIEKWHTMIQYTLLFRPSSLLWAQSYKGPLFGASAELLYDWSYYLPYLKTHSVFHKHTIDLCKYLEEMLQAEGRQVL